MRKDEVNCPFCSEIIRVSAKKCKHCGELVPISGIKSSLVTESYEKIGGWLYVVGFSLFFGLITTLSNLSSSFKFFNLPDLAKVISPSQINVITIDFLICLILVAINCYVIYIFVNKTKNFAKVFIFFSLLKFILIVGEGFSWDIYFPNEAGNVGGELAKDAFRMLVYCLVWIPYMLKSKRVKGTFTK